MLLALPSCSSRAALLLIICCSAPYVQCYKSKYNRSLSQSSPSQTAIAMLSPRKQPCSGLPNRESLRVRQASVRASGVFWTLKQKRRAVYDERRRRESKPRPSLANDQSTLQPPNSTRIRLGICTLRQAMSMLCSAIPFLERRAVQAETVICTALTARTAQRRAY